MELQKFYGGKDIKLSFSDNEVLIAIPTDKDLFEPISLWHNSLKYEDTYKVIEQFYRIFEIINILQLNKK